MTDFYFDLIRGNTIQLRVPVVRNEAPVDLTGATVTFTATLAVPDEDAPVQSITKTLADGITPEDTLVEGILIVTIDPEDTDDILTKTTYRCRIHVEEASGTETTVGKGDMAFAP